MSMLRKEENELDGLKNQIEEFRQELNMLKSQIKSSKSNRYNAQDNEMRKGFGAMFSKVMFGAQGGTDSFNRKELYKMVSRAVIPRSSTTNSFKLSNQQSQYQQLKIFKNISYKI